MVCSGGLPREAGSAWDSAHQLKCWCFTTDWVPMGAAGAGGEGAVTVWAHTLLGRVIPGWKETLHPCPESRFFAAEMNCPPDGGVK